MIINFLIIIQEKRMSKFDLDVLHQTISDTQSNICQAVIVKEGKLIYADTWNGYSINDTVHIASATKSVVALLVGIAIDKGYIDSLEQHILDFFPEYTLKRGEKTLPYVKLKHLLHVFLRRTDMIKIFARRVNRKNH